MHKPSMEVEKSTTKNALLMMDSSIILLSPRGQEETGSCRWISVSGPGMHILGLGSHPVSSTEVWHEEKTHSISTRGIQLYVLCLGASTLLVGPHLVERNGGSIGIGIVSPTSIPFLTFGCVKINRLSLEWSFLQSLQISFHPIKERGTTVSSSNF